MPLLQSSIKSSQTPGTIFAIHHLTACILRHLGVGMNGPLTGDRGAPPRFLSRMSLNSTHEVQALARAHAAAVTSHGYAVRDSNSAPQHPMPPSEGKRRSFAAVLERAKAVEVELVRLKEDNRRLQAQLSATRTELLHMERVLAQRDASLKRSHEAMTQLNNIITAERDTNQLLRGRIASGEALRGSATEASALHISRCDEAVRALQRERDELLVRLKAAQDGREDAELRSDFLGQQLAQLQDNVELWMSEKDYRTMVAIDTLFSSQELRALSASYTSDPTTSGTAGDGVDVLRLAELRAHHESSSQHFETSLGALDRDSDEHRDMVGEHLRREHELMFQVAQLTVSGESAAKKQSELTHQLSQLQCLAERQSVVIATLNRDVELREDRIKRLESELSNRVSRSTVRDSITQTSISLVRMSEWESSEATLRKKELEWDAHRIVSEGKLRTAAITIEALQRRLLMVGEADRVAGSAAKLPTRVTSFTDDDKKQQLTVLQDTVRSLERELKKLQRVVELEKMTAAAAVERAKVLEETLSVSSQRQTTECKPYTALPHALEYSPTVQATLNDMALLNDTLNSELKRSEDRCLHLEQELALAQELLRRQQDQSKCSIHQSAVDSVGDRQGADAAEQLHSETSRSLALCREMLEAGAGFQRTVEQWTQAMIHRLQPLIATSVARDVCDGEDEDVPVSCSHATLIRNLNVVASMLDDVVEANISLRAAKHAAVMLAAQLRSLLVHLSERYTAVKHAAAPRLTASIQEQLQRLPATVSQLILRHAERGDVNLESHSAVELRLSCAVERLWHIVEHCGSSVGSEEGDRHALTVYDNDDSSDVSRVMSALSDAWRGCRDHMFATLVFQTASAGVSGDEADGDAKTYDSEPVSPLPAPYMGDGCSPFQKGTPHSKGEDAQENSPLARSSTLRLPRGAQTADTGNPIVAFLAMTRMIAALNEDHRLQRREVAHLKQSLYDVKMAFLAEMEAREALELTIAGSCSRFDHA